MVIPRSCSMSILSSTCLRHLARGEPAGRLDQPVGERRFAMVDMGDDEKLRILERSVIARAASRGWSGARGSSDLQPIPLPRDDRIERGHQEDR